MQTIDPIFIEIFIKLFVALLLGAIIGTERFFAQKTAGIRTYALVSVGATLFVLISEVLAQKYGGVGGFDPSRIASQIIVGIGFLGAGVIIFHKEESRLVGLRTASGFWITAGIGMATGFGFFQLAIIGTVLTLFIFVILHKLEDTLRKTKLYRDRHAQNEVREQSERE